jgi:ATP-dependent phosphofructokinase / diphosphate-dependent phosphofructokinase
MNVAILTGGGDCPGLNAVIRAVVRRGHQFGFEFTGIRDGWRGFLDNNYFHLTRDSVSGILPQGGTILGTSRTNPLKRENGARQVLEFVERNGIGAVVACGGEDTLGVAKKLFDMGLKVVGIPKTIDNDLSGTDYTFGFDTAVSIATEAIDRLHSTAEAHSRVMVCEVMGRHAGHIALHSGLAGGADVILVPEHPIEIEKVCDYIRARQARGRRFSIIVVSEGAHLLLGKDETVSDELDEFGHPRLGGIGNHLAKEIERRTSRFISRRRPRRSRRGAGRRGGAPSSPPRGRPPRSRPRGAPPWSPISRPGPARRRRRRSGCPEPGPGRWASPRAARGRAP